jgi:hypothetical protein
MGVLLVSHGNATIVSKMEPLNVVFSIPSDCGIHQRASEQRHSQLGSDSSRVQLGSKAQADSSHQRRLVRSHRLERRYTSASVIIVVCYNCW